MSENIYWSDPKFKTLTFKQMPPVELFAYFNGYAVKDKQIGVIYDNALIDTFNEEIITLPTKDLKMKSDIEITIPKEIFYSLPKEIDTEVKMFAALLRGKIGEVYKYIGETTDNYEKNALYVIEDAVVLGHITFSLDGDSQVAIEGMTWVEWCESEYNTAGYIASGNYVTFDNQNYYVTGVLPSDTIQGDRAYSLTFFGTGGGGSN